MSEWISVNSKLPEIGENVIFLEIGDFIHIGHIIPEEYRGKNLNEQDFFWFVNESENTAFIKCEVTHWMPLPDAPK